jgi:hypothetical protein
VVFNHLSKIIALFLIFSLTVGCATKLAPKADKQKQEEVKQEVLKLLEKEYNQPFNVLDYKYEYKKDYDLAGNCHYCDIVKYGVYYFKIQAVDNPIIIMNIRVQDTGNGLNWFKEYTVKHSYCAKFSDIYENKKNYPLKNIQIAEKVCDSRGEGYYKNV